MSDKKRIFIKGNEAISRGALAAGCTCYFGYPITPQNDIPEFLSTEMATVNGEFVQAESEVAAANMLLGAAAGGARAMTTSSSPGVSLMQEAISYMAGSELPGVIVNVNRGGPGLVDSGGQHSVSGRVATTLASRCLDGAAQLGEQVAPRRVLAPLAVLDVRPFGLPGHRLFLESKPAAPRPRRALGAALYLRDFPSHAQYFLVRLVHIGTGRTGSDGDDPRG